MGSDRKRTRQDEKREDRGRRRQDRVREERWCTMRSHFEKAVIMSCISCVITGLFRCFLRTGTTVRFVEDYTHVYAEMYTNARHFVTVIG